MLSVGIVGLPNVGKSTLFNALTNSDILAANYPFATINPNVGIVNVPDKRLIELSNLIKPNKTTYPSCKFVDIAGLVKGASKGEGLGNSFLANIRETTIICHVVRCFSDKNITHFYNSVDPIRDIEIINSELIISDITTLEKKYDKILSRSKTNDKAALFELSFFNKIMSILKKGEFINIDDFSKEEKILVESYSLLATKKVIYVCNIDEKFMNDPLSSIEYKKVYDYLTSKKQNNIIPLSIEMECSIAKLLPNDRQDFMKELSLSCQGIDLLINMAYKMLGIKTFFTFGKDEVKGWSFTNGMNAQECAGIIHSDIARGFIRAEIYSCQDIFKYKTELAVKEHGCLHIEGKEYLMKDGDVVYFRFNV